MGSATEAHFARKSEAKRATDKAADAAAKLRKQQLRDTQQAERRELPALKQEMHTKLLQLSELVSARRRWVQVNFVRGNYDYFALASYEIDQSDEYEKLYLGIRRTAFGNTKLRVGFLRGWSYSHLEPVPLNNRWVRSIIGHADSHIERLKFRT